MLQTIAGEIIAAILIAGFTSIITTYFNKKLRFRQQLRFGKNLNRPIAFISNKASLKNDEIKLIKECWLFKEVSVFEDARTFTLDKNYGLIIYVFNEWHNEYIEHIVELARNHNLPIVLYANGLIISPELQKKEINAILKYPKYHMTQHTLNLLSAIFTTLSTYNHGTGK